MANIRHHDNPINRPQNFRERCAGPHQEPTSIYCSYGAAIEQLLSRY